MPLTPVSSDYPLSTGRTAGQHDDRLTPRSRHESLSALTTRRHVPGARGRPVRQAGVRERDHRVHDLDEVSRETIIEELPASPDRPPGLGQLRVAGQDDRQPIEVPPPGGLARPRSTAVTIFSAYTIASG